MAVEGDVLEFQVLFVAVLMGKGRFDFPFAPHTERLHFDLLGEIYLVLRHFLVNGFLGAPVNGQLLVALFIVEIIDFLLGKGFLLHSGKIAVKGFAVYPHFLRFMQDDGNVLVGMRDTDVDGIVLNIGLPVVMVTQIDLFLEHDIQKGADRQFLLAQGFTMWGASSLRSSPDNIYLTQWDKHFSNLREYIPFCREKGFAGMIQTSWSTSGQYGYIWDHNSLIELQPIREVYPAQAFDILWQAFFEAVNSAGPLRDDFVPEYLEKHFGLNAGDAGLLAGYFSLPQNAVTGKKYSDEAISGELSGALRVRDMLGKVRPRTNKKDYAQLRLMMDIRSNYLEYKTVEFGYESGSLGRSETAGKLKGLLKESSRLQKKFIRLNKNALKDPSIPLGEHSYVQQIKNLYERCR